MKKILILVLGIFFILFNVKINRNNNELEEYPYQDIKTTIYMDLFSYEDQKYKITLIGGEYVEELKEMLTETTYSIGTEFPSENWIYKVEFNNINKLSRIDEIFIYEDCIIIQDTIFISDIDLHTNLLNKLNNLYKKLDNNKTLIK